MKSGCINVIGGTKSGFVHGVLLPYLALVKDLRLYPYDDSTSTITAYLTTDDAAGS